MYAFVNSATVVGVEAQLVRVEVLVSGGLPSFTIVGLPGTAVQESRERVRAALKQLGIPLSPSRIVVNLAPADVRKEGPSFDLPIALGLLAAARHVPAAALGRILAYGELALDGSLRSVRGAVGCGLLALSEGLTMMSAPGNAAEAAAVPGVEALAPASLAEAVAHLQGRSRLPAFASPAPTRAAAASLDLGDVRGQAAAKRALEIAAAGRHNLLMTGPPGAGKTMLASRLAGLLPPLGIAEAIAVGQVHSAAGLSRGPGLDLTPPFRAPHHSGSSAGIIGGGAHPRPGEVSLAHHGVLFLDELPEFSRVVLEALRQPLEAGRVVVARAAGSVTLPARFQLLAARNPCPCGRTGLRSGSGEGPPADEHGCVCSAEELRRYRRRLSAPLLDRIDLAIQLPRLSEDELLAAPAGDRSAQVAARVAVARELMLARQGCTNAELSGAALRRYAEPVAATSLLRRMVARLDLSGRGFDRLLRVARTVADLAGRDAVGPEQLAEAGGYRLP